MDDVTDPRGEAPDDRALLFQAVIDSTPDAIFAKDLDGRYLVANRQAAFNMTGDADVEMVGRTDEDLVGPETASWIRQNDRRVIEADREERIEEVLDLPDGPHTFVTSKAPFRNTDGAPAGLVGVARDITEWTRLVAQQQRLHDLEHRLATTVQEAVLGRSELDDERIAVCARYQPAVDDIAVGGDWHDVVALPNGTIGLMVGDAVGHGIEAVVVMGQLRSALLGLALAGLGPGEALTALDGFAATLPGAASATCLFVLVDPARESMQFSCAGHMPPLLLTPDGDAPVLLDGSQEVPLATTVQPRRRLTTVCDLPVGSTLFLYTDGLVERRGESLDVGLDRLASAITHARDATVDALCDHVVATLAQERQRDDLAVVCARLVRGGHDTFSRRIRADVRAARELRHAFRSWASQFGLDAEHQSDLVLAVGEAVANAVEHAYAGAPEIGLVLVDAWARDGAMEIVVRDHGVWRPPVVDDTRGRGLLLMRELTEQVDVVSDGDGTTVTLRVALPERFPDAAASEVRS